MTLGKHPAGGGLPKTHLFGTLRLILAVMVIVQHAHWVAPVGLSSWLQLPRTGTIAVLAFFVLSGFIITEAAERFYERRAVSFFANRMLRIFPPLMLAMALSIGVHYSLGDQLRIMDDYHGAEPFSSRNLLQNLWFCIPVFGDILPRPEYPFIPYIWAIRTEFLFYGVVFCALLAASRLGPFRRVLSCLGVSFALLYVAWRLGALHVETLRFIPYFALGCAMYFARMRSIVPSATVLILTVVCLADVGDVAPGGSAHLYAPQLGFWLCLIWLLSGVEAKGKDTVAGELSYPVYLNQFAIIVLAYSLVPDGFGLLLLLPATIAVAWCANRLVEPITLPLRNALRRSELSVRSCEPPVSCVAPGTAMAQNAQRSPEFAPVDR